MTRLERCYAWLYTHHLKYIGDALLIWFFLYSIVMSFEE